MFPNAQVHVLNAGHFALDTAADEIAALVQDFVDSVLPRWHGELVDLLRRTIATDRRNVRSPGSTSLAPGLGSSPVRAKPTVAQIGHPTLR